MHLNRNSRRSERSFASEPRAGQLWKHASTQFLYDIRMLGIMNTGMYTKWSRTRIYTKGDTPTVFQSIQVTDSLPILTG